MYSGSGVLCDVCGVLINSEKQWYNEWYDSGMQVAATISSSRNFH